MTKNEIKKALYKQKPLAEFSYIKSGNAYYITNIVHDLIHHQIDFEIPVTDMGEAVFYCNIEAALLNRWIKE